MTSIQFNQTLLQLVRGDITVQVVDGIVNAANNSLLGGGGVDGAIHRAGGPEILSECRRIRQTRYPTGLPTGQAVSSTAGQLPARGVIHTVGPVWHGGGAGEAKLLADCYRNSLRVAMEDGLRTVAFPSISTGIYGYPVAQAAGVALSTIKQVIESQSGKLDEVRMVLFSTYDLDEYATALAEIK
jgi:O-acetyl-ADP-ribose deacetylase (regulator of RNase III)